MTKLITLSDMLTRERVQHFALMATDVAIQRKATRQAIK